MKKYLLVLIYLMITLQGQEKEEPVTIILSAGIGYKYHLQDVNYNDVTLDEVYRHSTIYNFAVSSNLWGGKNHIMGIEFTGFPYVYDTYNVPRNNFSWMATFFYRRNIEIIKNCFFYPEPGLTFVTNDASHIMALNLKLGCGYRLNNMEFFIENSFRISPRMLPNTPWFLSIGSSIYL